MPISGAEQWAILGSIAVTAGAAWQAVNELRTYRPFADNVLVERANLIDEETKRLLEGTKVLQWRKRRRIRKATTKAGDQLLTPVEKAIEKRMNRTVLGWSTVCVGSGAVTYAEITQALSG